MFENTLWSEQLYLETAVIISAFLFLVAAIVFFIKDRSTQAQAEAWAV